MAELTEELIAEVRSYIGPDPADDSLYDLWDMVGQDPLLLAQRVLKTRLADLLARPAQFSVSGYSENNTATIQALQFQLSNLDAKILQGGGGGTSGIGSVPLVRADGRRSR